MTTTVDELERRVEPTGGPTIVIENSGHSMHNHGDMAMLHVALSRLGALVPRCERIVLTTVPDRVQALCAEAIPLLSGPRSAGYRTAGGGGLKRWLRSFAQRPVLRHAVHRLRSGRRAAYQRRVLDTVRGADLLVATGGGYLTDTFEDKFERTLVCLEAAAQADVPIALLGHGLGPVHDDTRRRRLAAVLAHAHVVSVREPLASAALARDAGVDPSKLIVGGDDAIELAAAARVDEMGSSIGVNLRTASYAGVRDSTERALGSALARAVATFGSELVPLPITSGTAYRDADTLERVLAHAGVASKDGTDDGTDVGDIAGLLARVARCRVVVTGSYHAGVFALAQGIPVVALSASRYYDQKFEGLSAAFAVDEACTIVRVGPEGDDGAILAALAHAWELAPSVRTALRASADSQVEASRRAFRAAVDVLRR